MRNITRYVQYVPDMDAEGFPPGYYVLMDYEEENGSETHGEIVNGPYPTQEKADIGLEVVKIFALPLTDL